MSGALALGLGEIRTQSVLGEPLVATIALRAAATEIPEVGCFRLKPGEDDSLPWLRQADLVLHKGTQPVLEIRSWRPLRDPALRIGVVVGCGHDLRREYLLLPSLGEPDRSAVALPEAVSEASLPQSSARDTPRPLPARPARVREPAPERRIPARKLSPAKRTPFKDRLVLVGDDGAFEPSLRMATELGVSFEETPAREAQRELLRLEFRTLTALYEQATSQLAAAEKLRTLENSLGELQSRANNVTQRIEEQKSSPAAPAAISSVPAIPAPPREAMDPAARDTGGLSEWSFYGLLMGVFAGVAAWLGWRHVTRRRAESSDVLTVPEPLVDPQREGESDDLGGVDFAVEPEVLGTSIPVDLPLDSEGEALAPPAQVQPAPRNNLDSAFSVSAATVDEHFEVNPVMELAEIMLSFGRVKGAAQALQEYIDQSPKEALQPWIRLLEVYRMANMREDFERIATSLNQHFNVEVIPWLGDQSRLAVEGIDFADAGEGADTAQNHRAESLEELPHIREALELSWTKPDCGEYLQRLLRDNRGGKRSGFSLAVVQEILFLAELRETLAQMDREAGES